MADTPTLLTPTEFAQQIKAKYPDYANVPDLELAQRMIAKFPDYRDRVQMPTPATKPRTNLDRLVDSLPMVGGMVGGMAGGIPGAAMGGAAGEGYGQVAAHARELPGAALDVWNNLWTQPRATLSGAVQGAKQGLEDSGIAAGTQALYELGGKVVSGALSRGGRAVYRGFLKPSLSTREIGKAGELVETGIKEAIPVTESGLAETTRLIKDLNPEVDRILANAKGRVSLTDVANQLRQYAKREYYLPGQSMEDYNAVLKVADELDQHPSIQNPFAPNSPATASATIANEIKRKMYRSIGDTSYGIERGAAVEARKTAARGVKDGIEAVAPDVSGANARQGRLIDLESAIERATGREANRNQLTGVPALAAGATGATELLRGNRFAAGAMALATRAALSPAVATRAAIIAAKLGDAVPGTAVADIARAAVQAAMEAEKSEAQK